MFGYRNRGFETSNFYSFFYIKMTRKTTVCPNLKWTIEESSREPFDYGYENKETWSCKYKWFTFVYEKRHYHEYNTEDCPVYDEYNEAMYCIETWDLVAEDWACNDYAVVDYVKWLTKKQHTKDVIISMLLRTDLVYRFNNWEFYEFKWRYDRCNHKQKLKVLKKRLEKLSLTELYKLMKFCNIKRVMKMCSWDRYTDEWLHYYQGFWLNNNDEVVWEFIDINDEYDWDIECDKHSTFYLLLHYNWMNF